MSARDIVAALGGKWRGRHGTCRCPAHHDKRPSLSVADGRDGRLLLCCHRGCDFRDVLGALQAQGIATGTGDWQPDPEAEARHREEERQDRERRVTRSQHVWLEAGPISETLGERYMRNRGITIPLPPSLRFHPECWHGPTAKRFPAVVAKVVNVEGEFCGIHRTYLLPDGTKLGTDAKMMLGVCKNGAVRLGEPGDHLAIGEGIETCLAAMQLGGPPAWAALSTSGMRAIEIPESVARLDILVDLDPAGEAAARELAYAQVPRRREVNLSRPTRGRDFNDALIGSEGRQ